MTATVTPVPNQPATKQTNFRIPDDVKTRAQEKAKAEGRTLTDVVVEALEKYAPEETA